MGLLKFRLLSDISVCQPTAKGQILSSCPLFPPWHGREGGDIIVSLLISSVVFGIMLHPGSVTLPDPRTGPVWRKLASSLVISYSIYCYLDPEDQAREKQDWRGRCSRNSQMHSCALLKLPEHPQTCLGTGTTTRPGQSILFEETRMLCRHRGTHLQALGGVLTVPVPSTSMGLQQPNPHELRWKCTPEGPVHSGRNNTSRLYPQDFRSRDPWRE